jgi:OOP family OmpA-OmpF porin
MNFALRQLAKLENGNAVLRDNEISFEGAAKNEQDFKLLQQKLHEEVPNGIMLRGAALKPPSVSPFVWLAQLHSGSVNLSGHVPLESDSDLIVYARSLFGTLQVSNSMAWALGAPKGWVDAAKLSLNILNLLQQGTVILTDKIITVDGILNPSHTPEQVKAFANLLPEGFKLEFSVVEASQAIHPAAAGEIAVAAKRTLSNILP